MKCSGLDFINRSGKSESDDVHDIIARSHKAAQVLIINKNTNRQG
jgi:hypothetical protein